MKTKRTVRLKKLARRASPELKKVAQKGETITYGELGNKISVHPYYVLPRVLGIIWYWCDKHHKFVEELNRNSSLLKELY